MAQHGSIRIRTRPTVFFVLPGLLVTLRAPDSRIFAAFRARLLEPDSERPHRMPRSPADAMLRLLNDMVDRYLAMRQPLTDLLERRQQELLDPRKPFDDWPALLQARTELRRLENLCEEQLDAIQEWRDEHLNRLAHSSTPPETETLRVRADDLTEHIERVRNHARRLEGAVESAVQLHFSAMTHRTSEIMRTLTVLTAIFMPLTLITGIFGMNFDAIPGLHSRAGFWLTIGGMLLVAAALLVFFRVRRYLSSQTASRLRQLRRGERSSRAADADRLQRTRHTDRTGHAPQALADQSAAGAVPISPSTQAR